MSIRLSLREEDPFQSLNLTSCLLKYPSYLSARTSSGRDIDSGSDRICRGESEFCILFGIRFSVALVRRNHERMEVNDDSQSEEDHAENEAQKAIRRPYSDGQDPG